MKGNILAVNISHNCCYFYFKTLKERSCSQSETEISTCFIYHFYLIQLCPAVPLLQVQWIIQGNNSQDIDYFIKGMCLILNIKIKCAYSNLSHGSCLCVVIKLIHSQVAAVSINYILSISHHFLQIPTNIFLGLLFL